MVVRASLAAALFGLTSATAGAASLAAVEPAPPVSLEMWAGSAPPSGVFTYVVKSDAGPVRFTVTGAPDWLAVSPATAVATPAGTRISVRVVGEAARRLVPGPKSASLVFAAVADPEDRFVRAVRLAAFGDPNGGVALFRQRCSGCHAVDRTADAPKLRNVWGRRAGTDPDFKGYSDALKAFGRPWTYPRLMVWLTDAQSLVPGTLMPSFKGLTNRQRHLLIGFLRSVSANPPR